jgi:GntR family transcriptional repressor for pyruvate dehydrogenase complex
MVFQQLQEANRPRFVIDQILSSIRDGSLSPGERLPSEAKLAELTGVGRTSVREALTALRLMGVIETRVGDGSYVRDGEASGDGGNGAISAEITDGIAKAILASEEALQLQEARAVFETGLVRLAVFRWSSKQGKRFAKLLDEMADCARDERYEDYIRLHRDFHLKLSEATENPILVQTERSFLEFMDHEGWQDMERQFLLPNRADILRDSLREHRVIVQAIEAGDAVAAGDAMHEHFSRHEGGANGE